MIAIITNDGDGENVILALVKNEDSVNTYIKKYTGFEPKGFQKLSRKNYQEYYCKKFDENKGFSFKGSKSVPSTLHERNGDVSLDKIRLDKDRLDLDIDKELVSKRNVKIVFLGDSAQLRGVKD